MRRAAVAVMVGCAFGGIGSGVGHQHEISDVRLTAAIQSVTTKTAAMTAKSAALAMKTVEYGGYAIRVPATWPVYLLSKDPGQCVRYDVNAVYLGTPGPNQNCPPHLVGRADTVSIGGPVTPGEPSTPGPDRPAGRGRSQAGGYGRARQAGHDLGKRAVARVRGGHARQRPVHHRHLRDRPRPHPAVAGRPAPDRAAVSRGELRGAAFGRRSRTESLAVGGCPVARDRDRLGRAAGFCSAEQLTAVLDPAVLDPAVLALLA